MISVACEMPFYGTGECNTGMLSKKDRAAGRGLMQLALAVTVTVRFYR